jgi:hypothetical protein
MRRILLIIFLALAACQQAPSPQDLPTVAVLPTLTATDTEVPATDTPTASDTPLPPTMTPTPRASLVPPTATPSVTRTPSESQTPSLTPFPTQDEATAAMIATRIAAVELTPRLITLTPVPPGGNAPLQPGPQVMADIIISERQFQIALDDAVAGHPDIQQADVEFSPSGIEIELTAQAGEAFITGRVEILIQMGGDFATISIADISINAAEPPEAFVQLVSVDFFNLLVGVLDTLLVERVGDVHNLENLILTDEGMEIFLLVPES